ncbi:hypothetical protein LTR37_018773 [Vermiconidia calcicola]|uniref:Uncharacterized protein n=1 Tax=Vermiconidia calcicola TaxID=1690605 RepID=A0ACC3MH91_9PEZI|nr:hypothetical protein LTR37_018773 [Vermiconidia calcicola]
MLSRWTEGGACQRRRQSDYKPFVTGGSKVRNSNGQDLDPTRYNEAERASPQGHRRSPRIRRNRARDEQDVPFERPPLRTDAHADENEAYNKGAAGLDAILDDALSDIHRADTSISTSQSPSTQYDLQHPKPKRPDALRPRALSAREKWMKDRDKERLPSMRTTDADAAIRQAMLEVYAFNRAMTGARTDVEVWEVLRDKALKRAMALALDGGGERAVQEDVGQSAGTATHGGRDADTARDPLNNNGAPFPEAALSTSQSLDNPHTALSSSERKASLRTTTTTPSQPSTQITDLQILTHAFPRILQRTQVHLAKDYPSSSLSLALLPHIRSLGPTISSLGLTTQMYNLHLRLLWRTSQNIPAMLETLEEMDREVYEFNFGTAAIIGEVLEWVESARKGRWGLSVRTVWRMEGALRGHKKLHDWRKIVEERRREVALRAAREVESEDGGDDEGDSVGVS